MVRIEALDRRAHLSTTKLIDAGGLPRQLTAVGDVVYFAVDSKADGHLSYVDLTGYNVKTKARVSVRRDDGTKFGKVEYTLKSVDNRLRITELLGKGKTAEWTLKNGDTKAKRYAAPKSPVAKDLASGFTATATPWTNRTAFASGRGVYTLNAATGKTYAVNVPFEKHLDHIASIGAFGDKLIVDAVHTEGEKLYVVDRTTGIGARFRPTKNAGDATFVRVTPAGVLVQAQLGGGGFPFFLTDGTTAGTTELADSSLYSRLPPSAELLQADDHTLFLSNHAATLDPTDPERAGPYVAPAAGAVRSGSASFTMLGGGDFSGVFEIDLDAKTMTTLAAGIEASGLTVVGDALYYTSGTTAKPADGNVLNGTLYRVHLPSATVAAIAAAFEGAVFAGGVPIFVTDPAATTLSTGSPDFGSIEVQVRRDDARAKSLDGADRVYGLEYYLDLNHDGKHQKNEPVGRDSSNDAFKALAAGKYDVRLMPVDGWTATRGWSKTVTVRGGQPNVVQFGLADDLKSGVIAGGFKKHFPGRIVWIDVDGDGIRDADERQTTTSATGTFRFDGLAAGGYVVRRTGDSTKYYASIDLPGETVPIYS